MDIDASVWGDKFVQEGSGIKGYLGVTHHVFGVEFIDAFIDVFGKENLFEFLTRLKQTEGNSPIDDLGTKQIQDIFSKMGYSQEKIREFENELHRRLRENVFEIS